MSKKGKVKMGLGDFLGSQSGASQSVNGRVLPSGPDPDRDPDERRGGGGKRFDDDYDGPGARADGADTWRRTGGGGGGGGMDERRGGGGYDHERGGTAPETGGWRSRGAPQRSGGGGGYGDRDGGGGSRMGGGGGRFDDDRRGGGDSRDSGYDNPPPSGDRQRLKLEKRTAPLPMAAKEPEKPAPAPAAKPSGPRSNPFGAAQAVDTTQRDKEIEAKADAAKVASLRRRDESVRSSKPATQASPAEGGSANGDGEGGVAADGEGEPIGEGGGDASAAEENETGDREGQAAPSDNATDGETKTKAEGAVAPKPMGRWASLRREGGGEDRSGPAAGGFPRRDRDDDRRGSSGFEGRGGREERSSFGRRDEGRGGMDREPVQPPAPPAGNAFAKRFGSNFDRDSDRSYPRPSGGGMGGGGGFDRRDDDRRGGMGGGGFDRRDEGRGGFDRRDEGRGGFDRRDDEQRGGYDRRDDDRRGGGGYERRDEGRGGGMRGGNSRFSRGEESGGGGGGYQRQSDGGSSGVRPAPPVRPASPPSSLSKMSIREPQEPEPVEQKVAAAPEPEVEETPEPEPEPEPKEDPAEVARASAAEALESGKRGVELKDFVMAQEKRTTAGALLGAALETVATPQDMKWAGTAEFGAALSALSKGNTMEQVGIIYAVVAKCHAMGFPKEASGAVVQTMFMGMYNSDVCEEEAFIEWKDDVDNPAEGRMKAVMQTTPWFLWLESVDEEEEED